MKKLLLLLSLSASSFAFAQAPTTCSLDPTFIGMNKYGIWPDSATNFLQATVGQPYGQNITVKIPKDTVQSSLIRICFTRFEVSTPGGYTNFNLPPGLNMLAGTTVTNSAGTFKFPGNANSCAVISGTPTTAGTYTIQFRVQAFGNPISASSSCPNTPNYTQGTAVNSTTLSYYVIQVLPATGIKENITKEAFNLHNVPNPAASKTTIRFIANDESGAKISVYNLLGNKVLEEKIKTVNGVNSYDLNVQDWSNGIYFYTVNYKSYSESKRMVVNNNR